MTTPGPVHRPRTGATAGPGRHPRPLAGATSGPTAGRAARPAACGPDGRAAAEPGRAQGAPAAHHDHPTAEETRP
ncbi:hypothetical protein OG851_08790 [Streptomyces sp. NBC_00161]|uniref:hypothetical protein n=1 Tax=Streptomyces sp. NBC_00161 TaxID=2975671 RepID=UPI000A5AC695